MHRYLNDQLRLSTAITPALRSGEGDSVVVVSERRDLRGLKSVQRERVTGLAGVVLSRLDRWSDGACPAEEVRDYAAFGMVFGDFDRASGRDLAVEQGVREDDDVAGEAITADVAALPRALWIGRSEGSGDGTAADCAAGVVATVRADEIDRFLGRRLQVRKRFERVRRDRVQDADQVRVRGEFTPADGLEPGTAVDQGIPAYGAAVGSTVATNQDWPIAEFCTSAGHLGVDLRECGERLPRPRRAGLDEEPASGRRSGGDQRVAALQSGGSATGVGAVAAVGRSRRRRGGGIQRIDH